jgi:hypothetical protein
MDTHNIGTLTELRGVYGTLPENSLPTHDHHPHNG